LTPNKDDLVKDFVIVKQSSKGYKINDTKKNIAGMTDELEAVKQAIYLILNTERYQYEIYSWNYGVELQSLFGAPQNYAYPELKRRITEALVQDDRINSVDNFSFDHKKGEVSIQFTVHTIFGDIDTKKVVRI
jgi:phage baseplate assembly protein W